MTKDKRIKYNNGDRIGPYNIKLKERLPNGKGIFICPYDNNEFICSIGSIQQGNTKSCGCQRYVHSVENGRKRIKDLTNQKFNNLLVLKESKYRNGGNHILWECLCDCGKITYVRTSDLINNKILSCGCSKQSRGERKIIEILKKHNINYISQSTDELKCINPKTNTKLRFDFYLPDYNCCIEYDGEQHFKETSLCSDKLIDRQYRDNIKNEYCEEHDIKLIRIPYTQYNNIEQILLKDIFGE